MDDPHLDGMQWRGTLTEAESSRLREAIDRLRETTPEVVEKRPEIARAPRWPGMILLLLAGALLGELILLWAF
jgi:hypothetical protein